MPKGNQKIPKGNQKIPKGKPEDTKGGNQKIPKGKPEDTKEETRSRKSKDTQYNCQKDNKTSNDLQSI
jgi:hypothetical protein